MAKIIEAGTKKRTDAPWWEGVKVTCAECGTKFEVEARDQVIEFVKPGAPSDYKLACPQCGSQTEVKKPKDK